MFYLWRGVGDLLNTLGPYKPPDLPVSDLCSHHTNVASISTGKALQVSENLFGELSVRYWYITPRVNFRLVMLYINECVKQSVRLHYTSGSAGSSTYIYLSSQVECIAQTHSTFLLLIFLLPSISTRRSDTYLQHHSPWGDVFPTGTNLIFTCNLDMKY